MEEITVSAKTLDDAITNALIELQITSDQLDYDVIEKGSAGFLGIGSKQAVIRARRKVQEEPDEIKIDFVKEVLRDEKPKAEEKKPAKPKLDKPKHEKPHDRKPHPVHEAGHEHKHEVKNEPRHEFKKEEKHDVKPVVKASEEHREAPLAKVENKTIEACEQFLKDVLKTMGMEVEVKSEVDSDGALCINMDGANMGILIGKRGQTLDSLQYLTNRVANKNQEGYVRVKLDTEDYRKRRKQTLESLAKNIAYKVKRSRKPVSLEPMNPYERRIIHSALQGDRYVTTHSEGEEPYRRVVVTLKK